MFSARLAYLFCVRVRYAPSPTGPMHLGAIRTALFNYMFAEKNNGKFILRIEDTDIARNIENGEKQIMDTLEWAGIKPHQSFLSAGPFGPYVQSQRRELYHTIQTQLIRNGYAYPCFCDPSSQSKEKPAPYDGKCSHLSAGEIKTKIRNGDKYVIRVKSDIRELQMDSFRDQIFGEVTANKFDDFIISKRNRWPTYHFANVVDDWKMQISHVIRGAEWLTNTPKHIYLYRILGAKLPIFMHLPLIFTADGKKLSKRDPTTPVNSLVSLGYQKEAIINYTGLMGRNTINQQKTQDQKQTINQFYSMKELIEGFEISEVNNTPIRSDPKKLNFFNRHYLRQKWKNQLSHPELAIEFRAYMRRELKIDKDEHSDGFLDSVVECVLERISKFDDLKDYTYFFMNQPSHYNDKDITKIFGANAAFNEHSQIQHCDPILLARGLKVLHNLRLIFQHILAPEDFTEQKIAQKISQFLYDNKSIKNEDVFHLLRLAVTGRKSGVNIVKTCTIVGQERVQQNLKKMHEMLKKCKQNLGL